MNGGEPPEVFADRRLTRTQREAERLPQESLSSRSVIYGRSAKNLFMPSTSDR